MLEHKKDMKVTLKDPDGKIVQPHSQGDKYNLYQIENPIPGKWDVSVEGEGENEVVIATEVNADLEIDLPFASRFRLGDDIPIFADVMYKNKVVEGSVVEVEVDGKKYSVKVEEFLLSIQKPDGGKVEPFPMEKKDDSYIYFYKDADLVGNYTLDFNLKINLMNKESDLLEQKKIHVFQAVELPTVLFEKLKEEYSVDETLLIELSVTKNARLMQALSIPVTVKSPQGKDMLSVPRKKLNTYSLVFAQTGQEGEYSFMVPETEEYKIIHPQQSVVISVPSTFSWWKVLVPGIITLAIIGLLLRKFFFGKRPAKRGVYPVPSRILIWDKYALAGYIHIAKLRKGEETSHDLEYHGKIGIIKGTALAEGGIAIKSNDTVKTDNFELGIDSLEDGSANAIISHSEDIKIEMFEKDDSMLCFVFPASPQPPQENDLISPAFVLDNTVYIGQDLQFQSPNPNEVVLFHSSVSLKHASIEKNIDQDKSSFSLRALEGETVLNDSLIENEQARQLEDGDTVKLGIFTFRIVFDKDNLQLKVVSVSE